MSSTPGPINGCATPCVNAPAGLFRSGSEYIDRIHTMARKQRLVGFPKSTPRTPRNDNLATRQRSSGALCRSGTRCIREKVHIFRPKVRKNHALTLDHERWLGNDHEAFANAQRGSPAHPQRIDLAPGGRHVGDTTYLNAVRCIDRRANEFFATAPVGTIRIAGTDVDIPPARSARAHH